MQDAPRIPLFEALRLYWRYLLPITLFPTVLFGVVGLSQKAWTFWLLLPLFYWSEYCSSIPCSRYYVTRWFWTAGCVASALGVVPALAVFAGLRALVK